MNKGDILELAERVEALEGEDREIDLAIAKMRRVTVWKHDPETGTNYETTHWHYTASLDAAMTLVPEGFSWEVGETADGGHATVSKMPDDDEAYAGGRLPAPDIQISAYAATPALALTAACLRVIAERGKDNG